MTPKDLQNLIPTNPKLDKDLLRETAMLEEQLKKIGIEIKPEYRIRHPLDGSRIGFFRHNSGK